MDQQHRQQGALFWPSQSHPPLAVQDLQGSKDPELHPCLPPLGTDPAVKPTWESDSTSGHIIASPTAPDQTPIPNTPVVCGIFLDTLDSGAVAS